MKIEDRGVGAIMKRSVLQIVRRPLMWVGFFFLPLFMMVFVTSMLYNGLPTKIPAAIVDKDGTSLSREISQNLANMQMVDVKDTPNNYTDARKEMQSGKIYGYFLIPENFQADLLAGRHPAITFYTNMTYFVPGSLLYKTFKTTAVYTKAGVAVSIVQSVGESAETASSAMQPISIKMRPIGNPQMNYGIYLSNSFLPAVMELMILLMTAFSLGQEIKFKSSLELMRMADGSIVKALFGKLFPQTIIWMIMILFMTSWLFCYNHFPMHGSWFWLIMSELMFVLACQAFAVFVFGVIPNLRFALSVCALTGILAFSIAAFSFPEQSMYPALSIFSWLMPVRYNFLIYSDIALNGRELFYSRIWFAAYIVYMLLPFTVLHRIHKQYNNPVYIP
jgi:ABC-2 type transport system permease protein